MYDQHLIVPNTLKNLSPEASAPGFELGVRLPYYRGQWLSIVEDIAVIVDGVSYPREAIRFLVNGSSYSLDELDSATDQRWEFGEVATLHVATDKPLKVGSHQVVVAERLRISYLPWVPTTTCTLQMSLQ